MKKFIVVISLCLLGITVWAQDPLDPFFRKYEQDTSFTIVSISPRMFNLFARVDPRTGDDESQAILDVAKKLTGLHIIARENAGNGMQLFQEANGMISRKYEALMAVRDHGTDLKFLINQDGNGVIHNLIMLVGGPSEFFALSLSGDINLNEISKIAGDMNIQGFDKLKDIKQPHR